MGKNELWIALGPGAYSAKASAARSAAARADQLFAEARLRISRGEPITDDAGLASEVDIRQWARRVLWELERSGVSNFKPLTGDEDGSPNDELRGLIAILKSPYQSEQMSLLPETMAAIKRLGLEAPLPRMQLVLGKELPVPGPLSPQLIRATELMRRAYIEHYERELERIQGGHGESHFDPLFAGITGRASEIPASRDQTPTLIKAIRRFEADPTRQRLTESAAKKYVLPFRALREVVGDERLLTEISRSDCAAAQELIASIPPNVSKLKPYARLKTFREMAELARQRQDRLMSAGNVRVAVQHMAAFFNWAIARGILSANPGTRLAPAKTKSEVKRRPFHTTEMNAMLAGLEAWAGNRNSGRFWVPLIGIFMGLRLGEIVWLQLEEVQTIAGRPMLRLWRTPERSLKTDGSERIVPIHAALLELGFLQRVAFSREQGWKRVFQDLPGNDQRQCVDLFQKRFAYWQKTTLKLERQGTSFHSFRHGFRDALTRAKAPHDVMRNLGGWARGGGVENRYGEGAQPDILAETMARVEFPGLEWRSLIDQGVRTRDREHN
jgi:integrase